MNTYGETIYGTRGGILKPEEWGVITQKEDKLYVHILNLKSNELYLPLKGIKINRVVSFAGKKPIKFTIDNGGVLLKFQEIPSGIDFVVEIS